MSNFKEILNRKVQLKKVMTFVLVTIAMFSLMLVFIYNSESKKNQSAIDEGNKVIDALNKEIEDLKKLNVQGDKHEENEVVNFAQEFLKSLYNVNPDNYLTYISKVRTFITPTAFNQLNLHDDSNGEAIPEENYDGITYESNITDIVSYIVLDGNKYDVFTHSTYTEKSGNHFSKHKLISNVIIEKQNDEWIITEIKTNQIIMVGDPF